VAAFSTRADASVTQSNRARFAHAEVSPAHQAVEAHLQAQAEDTSARKAMNKPADIEPAIESALSRVARELEAITEAVERLESLVALIASAAAAK
jgi:hypothetical protein